MGRGRKVDLSLPPSRSRDIQRAFRERKKQRLQELEVQLDQSETVREAQQKEITQLQQVIRELQGENKKLKDAITLPLPTPTPAPIKHESLASEKQDINTITQTYSTISASNPPSILQAHQQGFQSCAKKDNSAVVSPSSTVDAHMSPPMFQQTTIYPNIFPPASYPSPSLSYHRSSTGALSDVVSPLNEPLVSSNEPLVPSHPSSLALTTSEATNDCVIKFSSTDSYDEQCCGGFFDCDEAVKTGLLQDISAIRQCG